MRNEDRIVCLLNGGNNNLYVRDSPAGGRMYCCDELGAEIIIWDTSITSEGALLAAIQEERKLKLYDADKERKIEKPSAGGC